MKTKTLPLPYLNTAVFHSLFGDIEIPSDFIAHNDRHLEKFFSKNVRTQTQSRLDDLDKIHFDVEVIGRWSILDGIVVRHCLLNTRTAERFYIYTCSSAKVVCGGSKEPRLTNKGLLKRSATLHDIGINEHDFELFVGDTATRFKIHERLQTSYRIPQKIPYKTSLTISLAVIMTSLSAKASLGSKESGAFWQFNNHIETPTAITYIYCCSEDIHCTDHLRHFWNKEHHNEPVEVKFDCHSLLEIKFNKYSREITIEKICHRKHDFLRPIKPVDYFRDYKRIKQLAVNLELKKLKGDQTNR